MTNFMSQMATVTPFKFAAIKVHSFEIMTYSRPFNFAVSYPTKIFLFRFFSISISPNLCSNLKTSWSLTHRVPTLICVGKHNICVGNRELILIGSREIKRPRIYVMISKPWTLIAWGKLQESTVYTVKPVFKGHCDEGTPCDQGTLSQNRVLSSPC